MGTVYHLIYFTAINKAAYVFGVLFMFQGFMFILYGVYQNKLVFLLKRDLYSLVAIVFITFALILYPIIGYLIGHVYPYSPTFGLPCPTTIFTFGVLLLNQKSCPIWIIIIPFLWSIIGFMAAFQFGILEDASLLLTSVVAVSLLLYKNNQLHKTLNT